MQLVLPLIVLLGLDAWMVFLFKKKFGEVLPVTLLAATMVVIVFAFFDFLPLGVWVVTILGLGAYVWLAGLFFVKRKAFAEFADRYFGLGFFLFLLVYAFLFVVDFGRRIQNWDEIGYWSLRVKEMMRIDRLYNVPESLLPLHRDYPPFLACFQYFWCKLSGGFQDRWMYLSTHVLELSMLIPCVEYFEKKKGRQNIVTVFLAFLLIVSAGLFVDIEDAAMLFRSIYSDAFMAVLSAYLLFFVFMNRKIDGFYWCNVCLGAASLMLAKPSGLGFFLIILIVLTVNRIMMHKDFCTENGCRFFSSIRKGKLALTVLFAAVIPYMCYRVWEWYVVKLGVTRQFDPEENRDLLQFVRIFMGGGEAYQTETIENYIKGLISTPLMQRPVPMAWWQIFLLTIALFEILAYVTRGLIGKKYVRMLNIVTAAAALGYAFYMCVLYVFSYDRFEATTLASFRRYLNTYWMCIWICMLLIFVALLAQKAKKLEQYTPLWTLAIIIWVGFISPEAAMKIMPVSPGVTCSVLETHVGGEDSVYVLQQKDELYTLTYMRYAIWPHTVEGTDYENLSGQDAAQFLECLEDFAYLYVKETDEEFFRQLDICPVGAESFEAQTLYRIVRDGQSVEFEFVAKQ